MNFFAYIRKTYHPLFHLRKLAPFRHLQGALDPDVWIKNPGGGGGMFVKLLRDASLILSSAEIEPMPRERFAQLLREQRPDVFLDIGANVGLYSWHARRAASSVILMFEPDPVNVSLCTRTISANRYKDIFVIPCAVSREVGVAEFVLDQASGTTGSLVNDSANPSSLHWAYGMKTAVSCPTITLDSYVDYCRGKTVVLKIDVEGAEEFVFEGGRRFFIEVRPWGMVECFQPSRLNWLADLGYLIEGLDDCGNYLLTPPTGVRHAA